VDADAARVAVETNAVAFDTEQAGTRAAGSVAFVDDEVSPGYDDLVADLAQACWSAGTTRSTLPTAP